MIKTAKTEIRKAKTARTNSTPSKPQKVRAAPRPAKAADKPARRSQSRRSAETMLAELKHRLMEISDLNFTGAVLNWDQATYMPAGGATARGRQTAMLSKLAHEKSVDPELGRLLDALEPYSEKLPYESDDASLIRVVRRDFEKA